MGVDQVIGEVRRDGEGRAQATLKAARQDADAIIAAAKAQAKAHEKARLEAAARESEQVRAQAMSRAESEARKAVLTAEAELREQLRAQVMSHFAALPAKAREAHLKALLKTAAAVIPAGSVWGADKDAAALKAAKPYKHAGSLPIAGGIVVESEDGRTRLDLSYETLLEGMWRDVLKAEAALFR
ncbi:MAG: V/A-type H+/Na+-transporting ATPase subunit [Thermoplasmata archaeon]|jgi:V/A-type H+-transporting ATPase subunit E|nr:V/A-type H+/Na+-transporting ATPase subunit [Thermoplasmata archaeon]MEA3166575.1 V/A-type H+/Na+-transporting ATPase subunit [Thermoplasmata archaeon]